MVFFLALLPTVIGLQAMSLSAFVEGALAMCLILSTVAALYSVAASRARHFFREARAVKWLNRTSGTVMAGAAVGVSVQ